MAEHVSATVPDAGRSRARVAHVGVNHSVVLVVVLVGVDRCPLTRDHSPLLTDSTECRAPLPFIHRPPTRATQTIFIILENSQPEIGSVIL